MDLGNLLRRVVRITSVVWFLFGCSGSASNSTSISPTATPAPPTATNAPPRNTPIPPTDIPTPKPTATPLATVRVVSYNVLNGAFVFPYQDWTLDPSSYSVPGTSWKIYSGNRLPKILSIIKETNPDILGIQEASDWDKGTPPIAEQVAKELGMNYFLAKSGGASGVDVALFTKLNILRTENFSDRISKEGRALRATLSTKDGHPINVAVVHTNSHNWGIRDEEIESITKEMSSYLTATTILMGDWNYRGKGKQYEIISTAGWRYVGDSTNSIDQVWISPNLTDSTREMSMPPIESMIGASDHFPVGAIIDIYAP